MLPVDLKGQLPANAHIILNIVVPDAATHCNSVLVLKEIHDSPNQ